MGARSSIVIEELHTTSREIKFSRQDEENDFYRVRFEVFTAVTMKNVIVWCAETQFVFHRRHITSPLQRPAS
jgi:hypothetical protein